MGRTKLSVVLLIVCAVQCLAMTYDELEDFAEHLKKTSQLSPTLKKGADPDVDYDDDENVSDYAWEESGKFEGDLILNERQRRLIVEDVAEGLARNGLRDGTKRWPNNEVIVYIQKEHFNSDQIQAIENGIEDLARASCVKFRPYKKGDRDAVVIQGSRRGCFSQVGYQGGYQVLNLSGRHPVGRGCFRHGTVVHELLHTLGFYHMQSSSDRDDYVDIIWANILQPARHNFRKYNLFSVSDFGVGYDYDSVLHYSRRAFSANGQDTIVPKQRGAQIGQRVGLSDKDIQKLNRMYCDAESESGLADDSASTKTETKKKNSKNKPFDGHGLGYHQGKAVVFKVLPGAETYKLPDVPSFHVFDYFSKEPQILSTSQNEGFRIGKEIAHSYKPPEPMMIQDSYLPGDLNAESGLKPNHNEVKFQVLHDKKKEPTSFAGVKHGNSQKKHLTNSGSSIDMSMHYDGHASPPDAEKVDADLIDAFDRLSKIITMHVYPSQTPDLSIYKMNDAPIKVETHQFGSPASIIESNKPKEKMHSAIKFINKMYEFDSEKSMIAKPNIVKIEKYEQINDNVKDTPMKLVPDNMRNKPVPWYKHNKEEYATVPDFEPPEHYRYNKDYISIYSPKIHKSEKLNDNKDDWYQKYVKYYPNHEYHDYTKDSSEGFDYSGQSKENNYSSSIPLENYDYTTFRDPELMNKSWYKDHASYANR